MIFAKILVVVLLAVPLIDADTNCATESGALCIFPFEYEGEIFNECTDKDHHQMWCDTSGSWGNCGPDCTTNSATLSSVPDAKIKVVSLKLNSCGGNDILVEVCSQDQCCTIPIGNRERGEKYTETRLPNECRNVRASDSHRPWVEVKARNRQRCKGTVEVLTNFDRYEITLRINSRSRQTNYIGSSSYSTPDDSDSDLRSYSTPDDSDSDLPQTIPCPDPTVESCPTDRMRMRGHLPQLKNQICQFLCDQVVRLDPDMPSSETGYFCTPTQQPMPQPKWCCLDGRKNNIPGCNRLLQNGNESLDSVNDPCGNRCNRRKRGINVNVDPVFGRSVNSLQAYGADKKSYNTFNEQGAHIIQETIDHEEDKIVTTTTPQHHDLDFTKMVFDKESNHMMQVFLDHQKCVIHYQPMLPVSPNSGLFENLKVAEEENTYESPIDGLIQNRLVEKVSLKVYVNPNPMPFTSLPAKFQKHCPSTFTVYNAHMVDPRRVTPEDPNDLGRNITALSK